MLNLFRKKITTEEASSSLYLLIKKGLVTDDVKDKAGNVLIARQKQRLVYLARFYDLLEQKGFDSIKMRLVVYWVTDNYKINNDSDVVERTISTLDTIQKINKLFDPLPNQEEFTSQWLNTKMFGEQLNLSQRMLVAAWCIEHSKVATDVLDSALRKFKITDS